MALVAEKNRLKSDLRYFLIVVGLLSLIGLVFVYSSSSVFALERYGDGAFFLKRHFISLAIALIVCVIAAIVPVGLLYRAAPVLFLGCLLLTALTLVPSLSLKVHGSNRWVNFAGISFQPSELLKLFLFVYLGSIFVRKLYSINNLWRSYVPFLCVLGVTFLILLKQPDFGSVVTILSTAMVLFFVAEFSMKYLLGTALAALPLILYLVLAKSYRLSRILIFLDPWADPQGKGFQIIQSLIAIGSGGGWGVGISNSKQKFFYLPMQHTDFIFSIIAEETGFIGALLIVILFIMFCFFGLRVVRQLDQPFHFFTALGFVVFITLQAVINIMVTIGMLPTKGLGLPFISYGGTALITFFAMVGLIINFARDKK